MHVGTLHLLSLSHISTLSTAQSQSTTSINNCVVCESQKLMLCLGSTFLSILYLSSLFCACFPHHLPLVSAFTLLFSAPSGRVLSLKAKRYGMNVELSWEDIIEEEKKGFLLGYIVYYKRRNDVQNEDGDKKDAFFQGMFSLPFIL